MTTPTKPVTVYLYRYTVNGTTYLMPVVDFLDGRIGTLSAVYRDQFPGKAHRELLYPVQKFTPGSSPNEVVSSALEYTDAEGLALLGSVSIEIDAEDHRFTCMTSTAELAAIVAVLDPFNA